MKRLGLTYGNRTGTSAVIVAAFSTFAAWQVLSRAAASLFVQARLPDLALAVRPNNGDALSELASAVIARRAGQKSANDEVKLANARSVKRVTDQAIVESPLQINALQLMAQSFELNGDLHHAEQIMTTAGSLTIRDTVANLYLLARSIAKKRYEDALDRADALIRITPSAAPLVYPQIVRLASVDDAHQALFAKLQSGPPWRAGFFRATAEKIEDPTAFLEVLLSLKGARTPLSDVELRAYLDPLIARGLVEQAYYIWLQVLPKDRLNALPFLYNGNFASKLTNLPFDWTIIPIDGAKTSLEPIENQEERKLVVQFEGKRVPYMNTVQMLLLPVGKYRISGNYRTNDLANSRGMTWRIYCAQRNDSIPIAETARVAGNSQGWKEFSSVFDVPNRNCGAQWLRLELAARVPIEQQVSGSVSYRDLKIDRTDVNDLQPTSPAISMPVQPGSQFERAIRGR